MPSKHKKKLNPDTITLKSKQTNRKVIIFQTAEHLWMWDHMCICLVTCMEVRSRVWMWDYMYRCEITYVDVWSRVDVGWHMWICDHLYRCVITRKCGITCVDVMTHVWLFSHMCESQITCVKVRSHVWMWNYMSACEITVWISDLHVNKLPSNRTRSSPLTCIIRLFLTNMLVIIIIL